MFGRTKSQSGIRRFIGRRSVQIIGGAVAAVAAVVGARKGNTAYQNRRSATAATRSGSVSSSARV